jgi:hypothetical protein
MDEYGIRAEALIQAIKLAPNNETGNGSQVLEDAQKFYNFLVGAEAATESRTVRRYRLVSEK